MSKSTQPDQRHLKRIKLMQQLFASTFDENMRELPGKEGSSLDLETITQREEIDLGFRLPYDEQSRLEAEEIVNNLSKIDQEIQQHAPERPLSEINQVDLAILRVIVWESMTKKTPKKVLIDEAVELAKEYGSESSPRFVNGVLGKLLIISDYES